MVFKIKIIFFYDYETVEGKVDWHGEPAIKCKHGGKRASLFVLGMMVLDSAANVALQVSLVTYLVGVMHLELADAANQLNNMLGTVHILTLLIAAFADTYFGRYRVAIVSGFFEFLGMALLTIQARFPSMKPPPCKVFSEGSNCQKVEGSDAVLLFIALYMIGIGLAGLKTSLPPHGADQFDDKDPRELRQMASYFNYLVLSVALGGSVSLTFIVWIQDNKGWDLGFGASSASILFGLVLFLVALPVFRIDAPQESSAITEILQVYVAALRKRKLKLPEVPADLYEISKEDEASFTIEFLPHTDTFRFLDKAAVRPPSTVQLERPESINPWKLCRVTQVENAKIVLGIMPLVFCTIVMTVCTAQLQTFSVQQCRTMDARIFRSITLPPASLQVIPYIIVTVLVPIYDRVFVPIARKITGHPTGITNLQRIGVGLFLSSVSMAIAGVIEVKRKAVATRHNMLDAVPGIQPLPISRLWLSIQYMIFGIADMFTFAGLLRFFYAETPKGLKSVSTCFLWISVSLGYFSSSILVELVNRITAHITKNRGWLAGNNLNSNHLEYFYWLLSIIVLINFFVYLIVSRRYKYRPQYDMVYV
ncbi:hypothetical protein K2173_006622 [Erythroxylum novogranatense]|uniref:Protein NRT1/ PTR FAMILY 4.5-like n=1 Tax=Erythroxylum novogranatense TaxID=1862640 RepID=A0AAV8T6Y7_9ROSI|nr:hypothetical protein K2173_006622 [Erythroxylum novogranatense]